MYWNHHDGSMSFNTFRFPFRVFRKRLFIGSLAFSALLAVVSLFAYQLPASAGFRELFNDNFSSPTLERGVKERIVYDFPGSGVKITMPRFLKNPRTFTTDGGDVLVMLRTASDTCGLYQLSETIAPNDVGPPPHFHYNTDEWFFPTEDSPDN